jgi:hypothetical protein
MDISPIRAPPCRQPAVPAFLFFAARMVAFGAAPVNGRNRAGKGAHAARLEYEGSEPASRIVL